MRSPLLPLLLLSLLVLLPLTLCETVLYDNCGQGAFLPTTGGNATVLLSLFNSYRTTSPYIVQIAINDGVGPNSIPGERETFFMSPPPYGDADLTTQLFNPANELIYNGNYTGIPGLYTANASHPNAVVGLYTFWFTIPPGGVVDVNFTYQNTGLSPQPVVDVIHIEVENPRSQAVNPQAPGGVVGDPQFVGLRGQSYQVHGIDGAVYNLVSERALQVNSRFVFLSEGQCPVFSTGPDTDCWSHPGSYLGEMAFQAVVDGRVHRALLVAGDASQGFAQVEMDGAVLAVGDVRSAGVNFSVAVKDGWTVRVVTAHFAFTLRSSDRFINQAVQARVALAELESHGLLGQTWRQRLYPTSIRYIEGKVDDYLVESDDVFGTDFMYNQFTPPQTE